MSGPGAMVAAAWQQAADNFDRHWQAIGEGWDAATPCEGWAVTDLVGHAVNSQMSIAGMIGIGTSPDDAWPTVKSTIEQALADPSCLDGAVEAPGPFGGMPKHQALGIATGDLLVHSWDLARAIDADDSLPAEAVQATLMGLQRFPSEMLRSPGMFGPALDVADDATEQDKLLAFTGRQR